MHRVNVYSAALRKFHALYKPQKPAPAKREMPAVTAPYPRRYPWSWADHFNVGQPLGLSP